MSTDLIVIHVIDRNRSVKKDFLCQKKNVLEQMKYFEPHLLTPPTGNSTGEDGTDVDITVHCDARVFEWLVNYISGVDPPPRITSGSVISLLVSSEFLQMERLMQECILYFRDHFRSVIRVPLDISCVSDAIVKRLSSVINDALLITLKDSKDKIFGRLYKFRTQHRLNVLASPPLTGNAWRIQCCLRCRALYSNAASTIDVCTAVDEDDGPRIHQPNAQWGFVSSLVHLRKRGVSWRELYWWMWSLSTVVKCNGCGSCFTVTRLSHGGSTLNELGFPCFNCPSCGTLFRGLAVNKIVEMEDGCVDDNWIGSNGELRVVLAVCGNITQQLFDTGTTLHSIVPESPTTPLSVDMIEDMAKDVVRQVVVKSLSTQSSTTTTTPVSTLNTGGTLASKPTAPLRRGLSAGEGSGLRTQTKTQPQPTPLPQYPTLTGAALMKSLPIALMSIDDLMFAKGTLTGGAVAAAAQLAHMGSDNSGVSQSRQREWRIDQLRSNDEKRMEHLKQKLLAMRWPDRRDDKPGQYVRPPYAPVTSFGT